MLPTLILAIVAAASFSAGGYSMLQQYLQHQTANHQILAKEGLQKQLVYCHDRFSELANGVLSNYRHINTTCTDTLNPALIKQMIVSGILHTVKTQNVQGAHAWSTLVVVGWGFFRNKR
jgi:hypothetical protein